MKGDKFCRLDWTASFVPHYPGVVPITQFRFRFRRWLCLATVATVAATGQVLGQSRATQSPLPPSVSNPPRARTSSPSATQTAPAKMGEGTTLDLARFENSVRPAVFW